MRGDEAPTGTTAALGAFLRALAERVERDDALAAGVAAALSESGLLPPAKMPRARRTPSRAATRRSEPGAPTDGIDPFAVLRSGGEDGLRAALTAADLAELHRIVRGHRLDPARISARWTARDRLVELIVTQVRARASHGQAFASV